MIVDTRQIRQLAQHLKAAQIKYAEVNALNDMARTALGSQVAEVRDSFTLRNQYTLNSLRVTKARTSRLESQTGSIQPYMEKQDSGGEKRGIGGSGANIALPTSSGESEHSRERRKVVLSRYRMKHIAKGKPMPITNRGGGSFSSVRQAKYVAFKLLKKRRSAAVIDLNGVKGVWAVINNKLTFVQDLRYNTVKIKRTYWHKDAIKAVSSKFEHYAVKRLEEQLRTMKP